MDIKLMCLGNDFKAVFDGEFKFTNYGSEKEFIQALSGAIETEDVLVLACQPELYTAFKSFVANAFTFKARPVKAIQRLIQESAPTVSSETVLNHSLIPVDADAILCPASTSSSKTVCSRTCVTPSTSANSSTTR